jgi:hypothetical protein
MDGPVQSILLGFHGRVTVGMNVITADRAYCLFPRMTFVGRRMHAMPHATPQDREAVAKYLRRGWRLVDWRTEFEVLRLQSARRVGDSKTWVIPFESASSSPPAEDDEVEDIRFRLGQYSVVLLRERMKTKSE